MKRLLTIALAGLLWMVAAGFPVSGASADEVEAPVPQCLALETVIQRAQANPGYARHLLLEGAAAERVDEIVHTFKGAPETKFTHILLIQFKDGGGIMVVGNDGRMCGAVGLPPDRWRILMNMVEGTPA